MGQVLELSLMKLSLPSVPHPSGLTGTRHIHYLQRRWRRGVGDIHTVVLHVVCWCSFARYFHKNPDYNTNDLPCRLGVRGYIPQSPPVLSGPAWPVHDDPSAGRARPVWRTSRSLPASACHSQPAASPEPEQASGWYWKTQAIFLIHAWDCTKEFFPHIYYSFTKTARRMYVHVCDWVFTLYLTIFQSDGACNYTISSAVRTSSESVFIKQFKTQVKNCKCLQKQTTNGEELKSLLAQCFPVNNLFADFKLPRTKHFSCISVWILDLCVEMIDKYRPRSQKISSRWQIYIKSLPLLGPHNACYHTSFTVKIKERFLNRCWSNWHLDHI